MGGRFTFSCDSHGVSQVGLNYATTLEQNVLRSGITELVCLSPTSDPTEAHDSRFPHVCWKSIPVSAIKSHPFFQVQCGNDTK